LASEIHFLKLAFAEQLIFQLCLRPHSLTHTQQQQQQQQQHHFPRFFLVDKIYVLTHENIEGGEEKSFAIFSSSPVAAIISPATFTSTSFA